jgi:phage protein D
VSEELLKKARLWCNEIRRKPTPLSEAIPMVQQLCDAYERMKKYAELIRAEKQAEIESYKSALNAALEEKAQAKQDEETAIELLRQAQAEYVDNENITYR